MLFCFLAIDWLLLFGIYVETRGENMGLIIFIIALFTAIRWVTYKKDGFESKSTKQKFVALLKSHWLLYSLFSIFALLFFFSQVAEEAVKANQPDRVEKKQDVLPDKPKFEDGEFFYLENREDGKAHPVNFKFGYSKVGDKYAVFLDNSVPKEDYITSQVFLGTVAVIYREILNSQGGDPSKMFELVPLDVPKNQNPKPFGKKVLRSKFGDVYFYFSSFVASDEKYDDLKGFVVWKETAE